MQVNVSEVTQFALNLALFVGVVAGGLVWFKRWIRKQVVDPQKATYEQVAPNGGSQESTRHLIENMAGDMEQLRQMGVANRDLATGALTLAQQAHTRLDEHIAKPHKE